MKLRTWCIRSGQILANPVLVFAGFLVFLTIFNPATIEAENGRGGITIRHDNVPIQKVFQSIEKQSGYRFFYNETLLQGAVKVTLNLQNVSLQEALDACFRNQPLSYAIVDKTIIVKRRPEQQSIAPVPAAVSFIAPKKGKLIAVRGKVTSNNIPVAGASIMIKGTENGASTDKDGIFTLSEVDEDATLVVSSVSYQAREIKLNGKTFIAIDLDQKASDLDEAVVVAYNTTTKRLNTGAVTVVKGEDIQSLPSRSIDRALQGMVPGLQITSGTGLPGGNVTNITLRGIGTGGDGIMRNPLYVLDGVILTQDNFNTVRATAAITSPANNPNPTNPMAQINPNDIESITVLKDASAIALYGSQASNGVILITTKKGKAGKLKINFIHQTDISTAVRPKRDILNQDQYLELLFEAYKNASPTWTDSKILSDLRTKFPYKVNNGDTSFYAAPNWFSELYNDAAASISNDLTFSGGTDKLTHFLSFGQLNQNGALRGTGYNRYSVRYNVNVRPTSWFNLGINTATTFSNQNFEDQDGITNTNGFPYYVSPLLPIRKDNGEFFYQYPYGAGGNTVPNPVAAMQLNQNIANAYREIGNVFGEVNFLKHFSFKTNVGIDFLSSNTKTKVDKRLDPTLQGGNIRLLNQNRSTMLVNNILRYKQTFLNAHGLEIMAGQEAQIIKTTESSSKGTGFNSGTTTDEVSSAIATTATGIYTKATFLSYFAQANYDYRRKYIASFGLRMDGSSRFGKDVPLKKYWSVGAGYVLSEETFLKNVSWLSYLKLRGSIGIAGNSVAIPPITRSNRVTGIYYSNTPATYGTSVQLLNGNPDVKPESTFNTDLGLEARFWKDRINITADIYKRKTYDMVTAVPQPFTTGVTSASANLGDLENTGLELSLSVDVIRTKNVNWNISGNWSSNKNKLTKAYNPETYTLNYVNRVGANYNSWWLVRWAGVDPADGAAQWYDKDGKITKTYGSTDQTIVGKPQPDGFGAVNTNVSCKNFQLGLFFYYSYGNQIANTYAQYMLNDGGLDPYSNQAIGALNRWQQPDDITVNPKRVLNNPKLTNYLSTRYLVDGDYIRLKNVKLSYAMTEWAKRLRLANLQAFIQANNLALWAKTKEIDPDNTGNYGQNGSAYPQQRTFSIGVNVGF